MALAKVVNLASSTDKTVILNVRAGVIQPFVAPDWLDLRIGFLLSLTQAADDDDTTDLAETMGTSNSEDSVFIGVKDNSVILPSQAGSVFIGYTNRNFGKADLISSDGEVGTDNTNFWRPKIMENPASAGLAAMVFDGSVTMADSLSPNIAIHFAQDASGAGGYATLLMLRLQRSDTVIHGRTVTVTMKKGTNNGDVLYTDTPTGSLLQTNLESFPGTVQQLGPVTVSAVPDSLFLYWPFSDSRLRIHAMGILKAR